jgi:hypothetical protein
VNQLFGCQQQHSPPIIAQFGQAAGLLPQIGLAKQVASSQVLLKGAVREGILPLRLPAPANQQVHPLLRIIQKMVRFLAAAQVLFGQGQGQSGRNIGGSFDVRTGRLVFMMGLPGNFGQQGFERIRFQAQAAQLQGQFILHIFFVALPAKQERFDAGQVQAHPLFRAGWPGYGQPGP